MRLLTILARFGVEHYPQAEPELAAVFSRRMPTIDRSVLVVDNALPRQLVERQPGRTLIGGDNRVFEFSAFDCALDFAAADLDSFDLIHFATSAFNTLYVAYLDRFDERLLASLGPQPCSVGHIDCYNEAIVIDRFRSQHWLRSCFFMMPPAEARMLRTFVSVADGRRFFSGDPRAPFRTDAPLSPRYQQYITDWLIGRDIGQGVEWHSSFVLTEATLPTFERKALSILNEHMLAIRLRASGCRLVDVTWLASELDRQAGLKPARWPDWREQLAGRDRDALLLGPSRDDSVPVGAVHP